MRLNITLPLILIPFCQILAQENQTYTVTKDIPYSDNPHAEQFLDLYWPEKLPASTIIFIHGGSLKQGGERRTSDIYKNVCIPFAENGISCITIDYRLAPQNQWPAMPHDVVSAIKKSKSLIREHGGNANTIFLFGHSSGCTLAATVGTNPVFLESGGLQQEDIKGIIAMGCILDNRDAALKGFDPDAVREIYMERGPTDVWPTPEDWISANPSFHVNPLTPPTLVVVAEEERYAPPILEQGARFVRLLSRENDVDAELVIVPGKHYSSIENISKKGDPTFRAIVDFMRKHQE